MNLLGARIEPEKELVPPPQPKLGLGAKSEWTMDLPVCDAKADLSSDEDN